MERGEPFRPVAYQRVDGFAVPGVPRWLSQRSMMTVDELAVQLESLMALIPISAVSAGQSESVAEPIAHQARENTAPASRGEHCALAPGVRVRCAGQHI